MTKRKIYVLTIGLLLIMLLGSAAWVFASDEQTEITIADLQALVKDFNDEGDIPGHVSRALALHLEAVGHFEQQAQVEKVLEHMESFRFMLEHQSGLGLISEQAYHTLKGTTDQLIEALHVLTIVRDGEARAVIVIPEAASAEIQIAAHTLAEYVEKSTGANLPVWTEADLEGNVELPRGHVIIDIGTDGSQDAHIASGLENLHDDGFIIHPHGNRLHIAGPSVWGTINGVHEFLERYVGVRWLLPSELGEDIPQLASISVPREDVRDEPAFTYREISPAYGSPYEENEHQLLAIWAQRNKLQGGYNRPIEFMHNLDELVPPAKYGESNPEFYPGGNPPAPGETHRWQPCFTVEGTIDAAVDSILEYFESHPNKASISLGVNDIGGYCEEDPNHPDYPGVRNSVNLIHMSEIYYAWVNQVVERVLEVYPDKWFGLLAYREVVDPPSFAVHPRVVPFLTKDRMSWLDEGTRAEGQAQIEGWNEVASQVGLYDYMYGTLYVMPRINFRVMADNFRFAKEQGTFGQYTEMAPNIGDGPKFWLAAKLQWDPDQDVDALLAEWYERAVGEEAAADLEAYYELWENFWTNRMVDTAWFNRGKNATYLQFTDTSYVQYVTDEDLETSKQLLESVVQKAGPGLQKERALRFQKMFEYYEASALSYARPSEMPEDEEAALAMYDRMSSSKEMAQKRHELMDEFASDDLLRMRSRPWVDWSGGKDGFAFWNLAAYLSQSEMNGGGLTEALHTAAEEAAEADQRDIATMLLQAKYGALFTLPQNPSFEEGHGNAPPWYLHAESGTVQRVEGVSRSGNASLLMDGLSRGGAAQSIDVTPGMIAARVYYYVPEGMETNGAIRMNMNLKDAAGANIPSAVLGGDRLDLSDSKGEWVYALLLDEVPEEFNGIEVKKASINVSVENAENIQVYVDDFEVIQASDPVITITALNFWGLAEYIKENNDPDDVVYQQILQLAEETGEQGEYAVLMLKTLEESSITANSSFEAGDEDAPPWQLAAGHSGMVQREAGNAHTGTAAIAIMNEGTVSQTVYASPGTIAGQVRYYVPEDSTGSGTIQLTVTLSNEQDEAITTLTANKVSLAAAAGNWASLGLVERVPTQVNGQIVKKATITVTVEGADDTTVYVDDVVGYLRADDFITRHNFWEMVHYMEQNDQEEDPLLQQIRSLAGEEGQQGDYARLLLNMQSEPSLLTNGSFESGASNAPPWYLSPAASVTRVEGIARTGDASVLINRSTSGLAAQTIAIQPGMFAARVYYYIPEGTNTNGTISMNVNLKNAAGANIPSAVIRDESRRLSDSNGQWVEVTFLAEIPDQFNGVPIKQLALVVGPQSAGNIGVYLDDFEAYQ